MGLGEARVARVRPESSQVEGPVTEDSLVAYGLGSCVALCLWDPSSEVAGMAHVVLPGEDPSGVPNPRYARSAVPALLSLMQAHGAASDPRRMTARLVGGAQVLALGSLRGLSRVGDQNAQAVQAALATFGVAVHASDLGGSLGRSVWFDPRDGGHVRVRAIGSGDRYV